MKSMMINALLKPAVLLAAVIAAQGQTPATPPNSYRVVNLVSNVAGSAAVTDPNLVDPWGFSNPGTRGGYPTRQRQIDPVRCDGCGKRYCCPVPAASEQVTVNRQGRCRISGGAAFTVSTGANASFIFATETG